MHYVPNVSEFSYKCRQMQNSFFSTNTNFFLSEHRFGFPLHSVYEFEVHLTSTYEMYCAVIYNFLI
jgi:hypothetical protein